MKAKKCLVVLGAQTEKDGSPSPTLIRRLNKCEEMAQKHPCSLIILCGGKTNTHHEDSEAKVMADYLRKRSLNKNRLFLEEKSKNTLENAFYCKNLMVENNMRPLEIYLISDRYHLWRAKMMFRSIGLNVLTISSQSSSHKIKVFLSYIREVLSLAKWFYQWITGAPQRMQERQL